MSLVLTVVSELLQNEAAFATATVIKTVGSASAKRAQSQSSAPMVCRFWVGWVAVVQQRCPRTAMECLQDGQTRIIEIDLDDEVLGVGCRVVARWKFMWSLSCPNQS